MKAKILEEMVSKLKKEGTFKSWPDQKGMKSIPKEGIIFFTYSSIQAVIIEHLLCAQMLGKQYWTRQAKAALFSRLCHNNAATLQGGELYTTLVPKSRWC